MMMMMIMMLMMLMRGLPRDREPMGARTRGRGPVNRAGVHEGPGTKWDSGPGTGGAADVHEGSGTEWDAGPGTGHHGLGTKTDEKTEEY